MNDFVLNKKEKIIKEIKPLPNLRWFLFFDFFLKTTLVFLVLTISISMFFSYILEKISFWPDLLIGAIFSVFLAIPTSFILANLRYTKEKYWITNQRVVCKKGIIGYTIASVPFEKISDVILSRTFIEKVFGFGSLEIQTLAGQYTPSRKSGSEIVLFAVPNPEEIQALIFSLMKE